MHRVLACVFPVFLFWWPPIVTVLTTVEARPMTVHPPGQVHDKESDAESSCVTCSTADIISNAVMFNGELDMDFVNNSRIVNSSLVPGPLYPDEPNATKSASTLVVVAFSTVVGVYSLVGTVGNGLVILAFCAYRKVRTTANTFILSISISDILMTGLQYPTRVAAMIIGAPPLGETMCPILGALTYFSVYVSFLSVTLIALSRCVLVTKSLNTYRRLFGPSKTCVWILLSWVVTGLLVLPGFLGYGKFGWNSRNRQCGLDYTQSHHAHYFSNIFGVTYWVTLCLVAGIYLRIYVFVKNCVSAMAHASLQNHSEQYVPRTVIKQTKHMFVLFCALAVSITPFVLLNSINLHVPFLPDAARIMLIVLFGLNHVMNPFLYAWRLAIFKRAFKALIRCKCHLPVPPRAAVNLHQ